MSVEILVVDDGSRVPVAAPPTARAPVAVLRLEPPGGVAAARNAGLAAARAEWISFLDDDDLWAPTKLRRQLDEALRTGADFAYTAGVSVDEGGKVLARDDIVGPGGDGLYRELLQRCAIPCGCSNLLVRTALARSVGGFDESFSTVADWDFDLRLSAAGAGAPVAEQLIAYTVHPGNMHLDEGLLRSELRRFDARYQAQRNDLGVTFDRAQWLRWRAWRHRLAGNGRQAARAYWQLAREVRDPGLAARAVVFAVNGERLLAPLRRRRARSRSEPDLAPPPWLGPMLAELGVHAGA